MLYHYCVAGQLMQTDPTNAQCIIHNILRFHTYSPEYQHLYLMHELLFSYLYAYFMF